MEIMKKFKYCIVSGIVLFTLLTGFIPKSKINTLDKKGTEDLAAVDNSLCWDGLFKRKVGEEIHWGGNMDYNYELEKIDTFFISYKHGLFSSDQLDSYLQISNGRYLKADSVLKNIGNYSIYVITETTTSSTYVFSLSKGTKQGCMLVNDFFSLKRPYDVFFTIRPPESKTFIDFIGVGGYQDSSGRLYDDRQKRFFQGIEELEGAFHIEKIYGIDSNGKFLNSGKQKAAFVFPDADVKSHYSKGTVPFNIAPYY